MPWDTWFTGTFSPEFTRTAHPELAVRCFQRWLRESHLLYAETLGQAWKNKKGKWRGPANRSWDSGCRPDWVLSCEKNSRDQGVHLHALIRWHPLHPVPWDIYRRAWLRYGISRIKELNERGYPGIDIEATKRLRASYLVKYSVKGDDSPSCKYELHISPGLRPEGADAPGPGERSERKRPTGAEALFGAAPLEASSGLLVRT